MTTRSGRAPAVATPQEPAGTRPHDTHPQGERHETTVAGPTRRQVEHLIQMVLDQLERERAPGAGRRPAREHVGPSEVYRELERLLGYRDPVGYRAVPSTPDDFHGRPVLRAVPEVA